MSKLDDAMRPFTSCSHANMSSRAWGVEIDEATGTGTVYGSMLIT